MQTQQSRPAVETLHRLLFDALLEIRSEGFEHKNKLVFHLADLFHNTVLQMGQAAEGKIAYEDVLSKLTERARDKGMERWLDAGIARNGASSSE